ncbi:hypothetical protein H4219_001119 [Mycoemilia scoparia]|uniref:Elongation factor 1 alpha-like protein n=1 Tax=Mycoemilia scoparia TaxID=417184 RepID=A0A9W8DS77_9FUNG|nr:hypothetical protein H4219_001119 [Mycoemilia scoparia]
MYLATTTAPLNNVINTDSQDPVSTQASSVAGDIDYVPEPAQKGKPKRRDISITDRTNLIVIGHVDAGKSTMMGHFLYKLADVDHRTMAKYKRDSEKIGKGSFSYAWVLDETDEERERGVTIDVATRSFETTNKKFTLLDAPGHRDFVPNMISGAAQADAAVLVIDAGTGGFESGFDGQGQTREHAILIRSLGVRQLIVAINKMDMVGWSEERYNEIVSRLTEFLSSVGFASDSVKYVPVSGLEGINLTKSTKDDEPIAPQTWYRRGPVLEELLDSLASPERNIDKPFRLPVIEFFRGGTYTSGRSGKIVTVHGRIVQGKVAIGDRLVLIPGNEKAIVKAIEAVSEDVDYAVDGENVYLTIDGIDIQQMSIGSVLCKPNFPVQYSDRFIAQIVVFEAPVPITNGFPVILHIQSDNKPAYVSKLISVIDQSTGEVKKSKPRHIGQGVTANVEIKVESSVCIDLFRESKDLGRIALRSGGITLAAGIITGVI